MMAYYYWWKRRSSIADGLENTFLQNAALESSLMSIRDLDDFFASRLGARSDDIVASDYGYPAGKQFLIFEERDGINKKLAHLTYRAAQERGQFPSQPNRRVWNNADLVGKAGSRFIAFLDHLEMNFFKGDAAQIKLIQDSRNLLHAALGNIASIAKVEMEFGA